MSTNEPKPDEWLAEARSALNEDMSQWGEEYGLDLIAEVERLRALTTVDDDMVKRATHAIAAHWHDMHTGGSLGRQEALAIAALEAAFGTGVDS